jgi:hypothetical protein
MADPNGHNTRLAAGALFSTAFPNVGVAAGALDPTGSFMVPLNLDAAGNLRVSTASGGGSGTTSVNLIQVGGTIISLGQAVMAASIPVVLPSNQTVTVTGSFLTQSRTGNVSAVAATTGAVSFLANNTARIGAAVFNNGAGTIYALLGTGTVNTTGLFTVQLIPNAYYEVPFGFLGPVSGIWNTANGTAQITEFT